MAAVSIVTNNFFALFFLEFHFCIECDYTHAKKSAFLSFFLKIKISPTCPLKEETFTLPEPTEEINPNPTSPDTPQISDPVPSSSVTQPPSSSSQPCPDSPPGPPTPIHLPCTPFPLHFILLKLKELLHPPDLK